MELHFCAVPLSLPSELQSSCKLRKTLSARECVRLPVTGLRFKKIIYSMVRWTFIASKCPHGASSHADEEVSDVLQSSAGNRNFGGCGELETFCRSI